jgi:hypothetical protein
MKIKIDSLELLHHSLLNPFFHRYSEEDEDEESPENTFKKLFSIGYPPVNLPYPLEDITFQATKIGENYSTIIIIDSTNKKVFNGSHKKLTEILEKEGKGYKFIPKNKKNNSIGSIFNSEGYCDYDLSTANNDSVRLISMGTRGAYTKQFPEELTLFLKELNLLENFTNIFLRCLLEPFSDRDDIKYLKDKVRYLNP